MQPVANSMRGRVVGLFGAALVMAAGMALAPARPYPPQAAGGGQPAAVNPDAKANAEFLDRVNAYVAIHKKFEDSLPKLPQEATPEQITKNQRALSALIQSARAGAKRGDLFTPAMTAFVKRLLNRVFARPEGKQLRSSIMDENVVYIPLKVNQLYPDTVPLTTMPPEVLQALPKLPEELEYRFVGEQLILLDPHAHIIADFIVDALPGR